VQGLLPEELRSLTPSELADLLGLPRALALAALRCAGADPSWGCCPTPVKSLLLSNPCKVNRMSLGPAPRATPGADPSQACSVVTRFVQRARRRGGVPARCPCHSKHNAGRYRELAAELREWAAERE